MLPKCLVVTPSPALVSNQTGGDVEEDGHHDLHLFPPASVNKSKLHQARNAVSIPFGKDGDGDLRLSYTSEKLWHDLVARAELHVVQKETDASVYHAITQAIDESIAGVGSPEAQEDVVLATGGA